MYLIFCPLNVKSHLKIVHPFCCSETQFPFTHLNTNKTWSPMNNAAVTYEITSCLSLSSSTKRWKKKKNERSTSTFLSQEILLRIICFLEGLLLNRISSLCMCIQSQEAPLWVNVKCIWFSAWVGLQMMEPMIHNFHPDLVYFIFTLWQVNSCVQDHQVI